MGFLALTELMRIIFKNIDPLIILAYAIQWGEYGTFRTNGRLSRAPSTFTINDLIANYRFNVLVWRVQNPTNRRALRIFY